MKPEITVTIEGRPAPPPLRVMDMDRRACFLHCGKVYAKRAWSDGNCLRLEDLERVSLPADAQVSQVFSRVQITVTP